ncbi:hypothetical protein RGE_39720 [Rubrivivax gelatinosus IL144]|uniref:Uncharacterized protein n=1 Tax=Rubrivivax gelatinosus (strain NBRC 100245 / IL144) TaxID=983917 RepID=I0HWC1_RUBGI|nr:hypothetical protein RGE_39720 [Rubrivivax gelatinosus IL144]
MLSFVWPEQGGRFADGNGNKNRYHPSKRRRPRRPGAPATAAW